jgi:hypothetical protein
LSRCNEVRTTKNLEQILHEFNLFVLYEQAQNPNTLSLRDPPNFGLKVVFCDFSKRRVFWKRHEGIRVQPLPSPDTSHVSPAEVWSRRWAESNMPYQFYAELARAQLPALTRPGLAVHKTGEEEEDDDLPSDAEGQPAAESF